MGLNWRRNAGHCTSLPDQSLHAGIARGDAQRGVQWRIMITRFTGTIKMISMMAWEFFIHAYIDTQDSFG